MDAYHSICEDAKRVIRTVENRYWKTTYTVIDIEKDVLGHSAGLYTAVFVGTEAEFARIDKNPQVDYPLPLRQATYMRSDLALAYE
ncbi:MAG TPA: hypothetical protein PK765_05470 [bacterium]|nr:hypothetical protein [bacterium]